MTKKSMYDVIKKQNGEKFAQTLRAYHSGIFDIPELDKILQYAGNNADDVKFFLYGLLKLPAKKPSIPKDPFELLKAAGYDAYLADTLDKQNAISKYFAQGEELCTFRDEKRFKNYYIINAVKKNADSLKREDFKFPQREDAYGASVLSIQILKTGGFISIKNRYNHTVKNPDNTFNSNPDNIIKGLSDALKNHFKVDYASNYVSLPENYILLKNKIIKVNLEANNYYFGVDFYVKDNILHKINKDFQVMCAPFIIDIKDKKVLNPAGVTDPFITVLEDEFLNKKLRLTKDIQGNSYLCADNVQVLKISPFGTLNELHLEKTQQIENDFGCAFGRQNILTKLSAPRLISVGNNFLKHAPHLETADLPKLQNMANYFLYINALSHIHLPRLETAGSYCLYNSPYLKTADLPKLKSVEDYFLFTNSLSQIRLSEVETIGNHFMYNSPHLKQASFNKLKTVADDFLSTNGIEQIDFQNLQSCGDWFMHCSPYLKKASFNALQTVGDEFLYRSALTEGVFPQLEQAGEFFMHSSSIKKLICEKLKTIKKGFLGKAKKMNTLIIPNLENTTPVGFDLLDLASLKKHQIPDKFFKQLIYLKQSLWASSHRE